MTSPAQILHLEDDPCDREMVRNAVSNGLECNFRYAATEAEFVGALEGGFPDVILADHTLPGFDGVTALEIVREKDSWVPFIFVTGSLSEEEAIATFRKGANDYILKDRLSRLRPAIVRALRDVAEAKRALEADARIREQAALLEKAQDAILVCGPDYKIRFWNRSAERLFGLSVAEAVGESVERVLIRNSAALRSAWTTTLVTGSWTGEASGTFRDGARVVLDSSWSLLRSENGEPEAIMIINTDVSEKKLLEEQFLRAQRMESIGILSGGIAHDLNNVLSPIMLGTQLLRAQVLDPRSVRVVDMIDHAATHGSDLIKQILAFARGVEGERVEISPEQTIRETGKLLSETLPRSIVLEIDIAPEVWTIKAVPTQLTQILMNLCVNARDAMPEGGRMRIRAANTHFDEGNCPDDPNAVPGNYVAITVSDTGTGMPPEVLKKLYLPFFTTKAAGKGTGLGLSTVRNIVKNHNGFINIHSKPGMGTTFECYFPPSRSQSDKADEKEETETSRGGSEQILVVDDDPGVMEAIRLILEHSGYSVLSASNGSDALSLYHSRSGDIDLVITDFMMPSMDGDGLIAALREANPEVKIIVVSGLLERPSLPRLSVSGGMETLRKPFTAMQLCQTVESVLRDGNVGDEAKGASGPLRS